MNNLRAAWAVLLRNGKLLTRQKHLLAQPVLVPLVVLTLSALVMGGQLGDAFPVALVNQATSPEASEFVHALQESRSNISRYFTVVETDPERAEAMLSAGRVLMAINIPEDFADTGRLEVGTFNINSDATKNTRLRLEHAINRYLQQRDGLMVVPNLETARPQDVWRSAFLGGSSVLLALFFGATLIAANLHAFERENRTQKVISLTPQRPASAGLSIIVSAVISSLLTSLPTLLVALALFRLRVTPAALLQVYSAMIPILIGCAGLGLLLAAVLQRYRTIQPLVILTCIATFFVGGGFVSVNALPPAAQQVSQVWLFSRIFEWLNPVLHGFDTSLTAGQWGWLVALGVLGLMVPQLSHHPRVQRTVTGGQ